MNINLPDDLLVTLVRHKFYSAIDYEKCEMLESQLIEKNFRVVVKHLCAHYAKELPESEKSRLEEELISEFREFGFESMSVYMKRLKPHLSIRQRAIEWLMAPLEAVLEMTDRRPEAQKIRLMR